MNLKQCKITRIQQLKSWLAEQFVAEGSVNVLAIEDNALIPIEAEPNKNNFQ